MSEDNKRHNKYFKEKNFVFLLLLFFLASCIFHKKINYTEYISKNNPPGTKKIKSNFYYDETEVTNLDWMEYLYWTNRVFGYNSEEFIAALPDTNVWLKFPCLNYINEKNIFRKDTFNTFFSFRENYLRHPVYRDYPIVGISQKQALQYSKWRSDRVYEYILIMYGKIKINPEQDRNSYFTIETYLRGNYNGYIPDTNFMFYPAYRLPTIQEWKNIVYYPDSIKSVLLHKRNLKKINDYRFNHSDFNSDVVPCINGTIFEYPINHRYSFWPDIYGLYNMRGNVREWTDETDVCIGGGWADCKQIILRQDTFMLKTQDAWTGFRNVCEWKEWKK